MKERYTLLVILRREDKGRHSKFAGTPERVLGERMLLLLVRYARERSRLLPLSDSRCLRLRQAGRIWSIRSFAFVAKILRSELFNHFEVLKVIFNLLGSLAAFFRVFGRSTGNRRRVEEAVEGRRERERKTVACYAYGYCRCYRDAATLLSMGPRWRRRGAVRKPGTR